MGGILQVDSVLNNNTSNLITQTNSTTITIGSTGQTISLASGASSSGFGLTWNPTVQTTNFTASVGVGYMVNTTTAAITATLPAAPSIGDQVAFVDFNETAATNNIILDPNGLKIDGIAATSNMTKGGEGVTILYSGTTRGWIPVSAANEGTAALISQFSLDFLVIAGGAGGAGYYGGAGGGAGGYRTSTQSVNQGTVITVTVGDGSAGVFNSPSQSTNGSNSSISGSGLTTITSAGGGGAGAGSSSPAFGKDGGSGGGGGGWNYATDIPGGSGNTPSTSPSQGNNGGQGAANTPGNERGGGGGGGAGGVGGNGSTNGGSNGNGGNGGAGTASSITGSSVTRAGGGGGGVNVGTPGTATGGGGAGVNSGTGNNGTANTGGGGGGSGGSGSGNGGSGGKGVVIISVATIHYSGTSSGSPTVTTSGSNTILQFNGSGTYTV
jgi:hypothetical protein